MEKKKYVKCAPSYVITTHQIKVMGLKQGSWFTFLHKVEDKKSLDKEA
jgi:hypothetical protein